MRKVYEIGKQLIEKGEDFVIAKLVDTSGSTPRKKGAWLLMRKDGTRYGTVGGGILEAEVERIARETFATGESGLHYFKLKPEDQHSLDMRCGGDANVFIEYVNAESPGSFLEEILPKHTAIIFGAGHVGLALEPLLRHVGFSTTVVDDRLEYANRERFDKADRIELIKSFNKAFEDIETDENSYIVIMTRGHSYDYIVLRQALEKKAAYIGMIGSKIKVADTMKKLKEDGFTQEELDRIYSPIGIQIYGETPEEIGVSIAAEMIKVRAGHGER